MIYLLKFTCFLITSLLLSVSFSYGQSLKSVQFCLQFKKEINFQPAFLSLKIYSGSTITYNQNNINRIDTCIRVSGTNGKIYRAVLTGEGIKTNIYEWQYDTSRVNQKILLTIIPDLHVLKEVTIKGDRGMITHGDSLIIGVDSIRTKPHANASELLGKIPGVDIQNNGNITVLGTKVNKIKVDGKELFGGNPKATLESIKADMIKDLEIVTVNDGSDNNGKELNLRLKPDRKNGAYGEVALTGGTSNRFLTGIKVNRISPDYFFNLFFNQNNTNTRALSDNDYLQLVGMRGGFATNGLATQQLYYDYKLDDPFSRLSSLLNNGFFDKGVTKSTSTGASFNKTTKNLTFNSYFLASSNRTIQTRHDSIIRFIDPATQTDLSDQSYNLVAKSIVNENTFKWAKNEKNVLQGKLTLQHQSQTDQPIMLTQSSLVDDPAALFQSSTIINKKHNYNSSNLLFARGSWEHRYNKPAEKTTISAGTVLKSFLENDLYSNDLIGQQGGMLTNNNLVNQNGTNRTNYLEVEHSIPLSGRFLLDFHASAINSNYVNQINGFDYNNSTLNYEQYNPVLSVKNFKTNLLQETAQSFLFYKYKGLTLIAGVGILQSNWRVKKVDTLLNENKKLYFLPTFYACYTYGQSRLSFIHTKELVLPAYDNLLPVQDSSNIQQVHQGNATLNPYPKDTYNLSLSTTVQGLGNISLAANYQFMQNPVNPSNEFGSGFYPLKSYLQFADTRQVNLIATWFKFNQLKKVNFFAFIIYLKRKQYQQTAGTIYPIDFYNLNSTIGIKWALTKENQLNISLRPSLNGTINQSTGAGSYKQLYLDVKEDNKLFHLLYYNFTTKWMLASSTLKTYSIKPIIGLNFYQYFTSNQRLQINAGVSNLLNVKYIQDYTITPLQQTVSRVDYLNRFVSVGIIYYAEKWKKGHLQN